MSADPISLLVSGVGGAVVGVGASYYVFYSKPKRKQVKVVERDDKGSVRVASVSEGELDRSKHEMRALVVERDLLSSALMRLYEAESEGRITREEREVIAKKYSEQVRTIEDKLKDVELVVEVGELEKLRDELVSLFREKVENIEARLDHAKERLGSAAPAAVKKQPVQVEKGEELEKVVAKRARPEMSESEKRVKELRDEVMEALTKLEEIDLEKKPQESA